MYVDFDVAVGEDLLDVLFDSRGRHAFRVGVAHVAGDATPAFKGDSEVDDFFGFVGVGAVNAEVCDEGLLRRVEFSDLNWL